MPRIPSRPLAVRAPGMGLGSQLSVLFWTAAFAAATAFFVVPLIGDLATDFGLDGKARPVAGAHVRGSCSTYGGVLTRCDATLVAPGSGGEIQRKVDYFFVDLHVGDYGVRVVADPAQPALLTTDLALDKLRNRTITLVIMGPLFALLAGVALAVAGRTVRSQRATRRALSNQVLRPILLRMEGYTLGRWQVRASPDALGRTWHVPRGARPIVMDPAQKLVLGVTSGDGAVSMPLDRELRWLGLEAAERAALLDELGPDRLGAWLPALTRGAADTERVQLHRRVRRMAVAGLVFGIVAAGAAWLAFADHDTGTGELVSLQRGDEAPRTKLVKLRGIAQRKLAAKTSWTDATTAHLEVWLPVTAEHWKPGQPVSWIVQDPMYGVGETERATFAGTVSDTALPERAITELRRTGITLASPVRRLDAVLPPESPLHAPALVTFIACIALSLALLILASGLHVRVRRMEQLRS